MSAKKKVIKLYYVLNPQNPKKRILIRSGGSCGFTSFEDAESKAKSLKSTSPYRYGTFVVSSMSFKKLKDKLTSKQYLQPITYI